MSKINMGDAIAVLRKSETRQKKKLKKKTTTTNFDSRQSVIAFAHVRDITAIAHPSK